MSGFTPGPWFYEGAECGGRVLACDDRETIIHQPPCNPWNEQVRADARLIAAAPDLLAALVAMNADYKKALAAIAKHDGPVTSRLSDEADAAIAKATWAGQ